jgi:ABC-type polysaccharide/polyol phosphate transport system ATPase subunit
MFFGAAFDPPKREFVRLLEDVSFEVAEGDRVAILGRNGAGKSTLLRVMNGVYAPTSGEVRVEGSRQALLNISLGFNVDATVRENIFLRGTAMHLRASQLRDEIDEILDFAGLHDKSNHRLRTLSSGQRMRLGFAISTMFQHDVILMDEWVGTGDSEFMAKATERMKSRVGGSKIVMLASHSIGLLRDICNKGIVIEQGRLVHAAGIVDALKAYHDLMSGLRVQDAAFAADGEGTAGGALAYGSVEAISVENGSAYLQGWCITTEGVAAPRLVLERNGSRHALAEIERYPRPDVMKHFGLSDDRCGFRARFDIPGIENIACLGADMLVLGGADATQPLAPLRMAPAVSALLDGQVHEKPKP